MFSGFRRARADLATMNILLPAAERIAAADGVAEPGAEHLLLAALDLPDGVAAAALATVGVDRTRLHRAIRAQHAAALRSVGVIADDAVLDARLPSPTTPTGPYRSQGSLQDTFQRATGMAKQSGSPLGSGHVLLAVLELEYGTLTRTFDDLSVDREALGASMRAELDA